MITDHGIMVDIETLSTDINATIVQIGALKFNLDKGIHDTFLVNILPEPKKYNTHVSKDTLEWWMKQPKEIRMSWQVDQLPLPEALTKFNGWLSKFGKAWMYCNGLSFDYPAIRWSYNQTGIKQNWDYWKEVDSRTINSLFDYRLPPGNNHNALDDATHQATHLLKLFKSFSEI